MSGLLEGKVVVVTGAAQPGSIGDAIASRCAENGATVVVTSRAAAKAEDAAQRLRREGARADGVGVDLSDEASVARCAREILHRHTRVHGIVHNAGMPLGEWERSFLEVPTDEFARAFDVDVLGAVRLTRALLPSMRELGGSLVFTSSTPALAGYEYLHEFAPAKAGVLGLMRGLAAEFGRDNVRSNAVAYGNIASPATLDALDEAARESLGMESPMRRWGTPRDAAGASVFLLSDLASFVNGQVIVVDGGAVMR